MLKNELVDQFVEAGIGGRAIGVTHETWPRSGGRPLHHVLTLDSDAAAALLVASALGTHGLGGGWVAHADGSRAVSDDMKIGGYVLTPALRATSARVMRRSCSMSICPCM